MFSEQQRGGRLETPVPPPPPPPNLTHPHHPHFFSTSGLPYLVRQVGVAKPLRRREGGASGRIPLLRLLRVEFQSLPPPPPPLFRWKTVEKGRLKEASLLLQRGEASEEGGRILRAVSRESRVGLRGGFCVFPPNFFSSPLFGESWRSAGTRRKERRKRPISFPGSASSSLLLCPSIATAS